MTPFQNACVNCDPSCILLYLDHEADPLKPPKYYEYVGTKGWYLREIEEEKNNNEEFVAFLKENFQRANKYDADKQKEYCRLVMQVVHGFISYGFDTTLMINKLLSYSCPPYHREICKDFDSFVDYNKWTEQLITRASNANDNRRLLVSHRQDLKTIVEEYGEKIDNEILKKARNICSKNIELDLYVLTGNGCFHMFLMLCGVVKPEHITEEEDMTILDFKKKIQKIHPKLSNVKLEEIKLPSRAPIRKDLPDEQNYMQDDKLLSDYEFEERTFLHVHLF